MNTVCNSPSVELLLLLFLSFFFFNSFPKSYISSFAGKQNVKLLSKRKKKQLQKEARRNQLIQIRKKKRSEVLDQKRHLGGQAPFLICIIPLQEDIDIQNIMSLVTSMNESAEIVTSLTGIVHIKYVVK